MYLKRHHAPRVNSQQMIKQTKGYDFRVASTRKTILSLIFNFVRLYSFTVYYQGSKGKRQWLINWCTSSMMIHKINPFCRLKLVVKSLDTLWKLNEPTNQNSLKSPKFVKPTKKNTYYNTLGTGVINTPRSPSSWI